MRIYADVTEPARFVHALAHEARRWGIDVQRTILHKRPGLGTRARARHPHYGMGSDYLLTDEAGTPVAGTEHKTLDDLARSIVLADPGRGPRIFHELRDLRTLPSPIVLLEGPPTPRYLALQPAALGIQLWCAEQGISTVFASDAASSRAAITSPRAARNDQAETRPVAEGDHQAAANLSPKATTRPAGGRRRVKRTPKR